MTQKKEIRLFLFGQAFINTIFLGISFFGLALINNIIKPMMIFFGIILCLYYIYSLSIYIIIGRFKRAKLFHLLYSVGSIPIAIAIIYSNIAYQNISNLSAGLWFLCSLFVLYFSYLDTYKSKFRMGAKLIEWHIYNRESRIWTLKNIVNQNREKFSDTRSIKIALILLFIFNPILIYLTTNFEGILEVFFIFVSIVSTLVQMFMSGSHLAYVKCINDIENKDKVKVFL